MNMFQSLFVSLAVCQLGAAQYAANTLPYPSAPATAVGQPPLTIQAGNAAGFQQSAGPYYRAALVANPAPVAGPADYTQLWAQAQADQLTQLRQLEAQQNVQLAAAGLAKPAQTVTFNIASPQYGAAEVEVPFPKENVEAAQAEAVEAYDEAEAAFANTDAILKGTKAVNDNTVHILDQVLARLGADPNPAARAKAEELRVSFANIANRFSTFAERLKSISESLPKITQLLALQKEAAAKGVSFDVKDNTA